MAETSRGIVSGTLPPSQPIYRDSLKLLPDLELLWLAEEGWWELKNNGVMLQVYPSTITYSINVGGEIILSNKFEEFSILVNTLYNDLNERNLIDVLMTPRFTKP